MRAHFKISRSAFKTSATMYLDFFKLKEPPFSLTSHPKFFFGGAQRQPLLEGLLYAVKQGEGILKISGEVGSGKSMLCRMLIEALPEHIHSVYLVNPRLSPKELLVAIASELRLSVEQIPAGGLVSLLQRHLIELFAKGKQVVVLIDEAHAMPVESLEEIRLLSNLETGHYKLLQIVLFGQPELDEVLSRRDMRQLRERISYSFFVPPMNERECQSYLDFRLFCAGNSTGDTVFSPAAVKEMTRLSCGLMRRINLLADKSLLAAFVDHATQVTEKHVHRAALDVNFAQEVTHKNAPWLWLILLAVLFSILILAFFLAT